MDKSADVLQRLYREQLETAPSDRYLREHAATAFQRGTVQVFEFYRRFLPDGGRILDWGCRHAPDACLLRAAMGGTVEIEGCDVIDPGQYRAFFEFAGLRYERLRHPFLLPYEDSRFDAVIASGVLEHVPMDYESLKELNRVLKVGGRLVIAYLPNRASAQEWWLRMSGGNGHKHLYRREELTGLLMRSGFMPLAAGYQTRMDCLGRGGVVERVLIGLQAHRFTSCLCAVGEKVTGF